MKPINLLQYYELGSKVEAITLVADKPLADVVWGLLMARLELTGHITTESILPKSSQKAAQQLLTALEPLVPSKIEDIAGIGKERLVNQFEAYAVNNAKRNFSTILASDCPEIAVYFVEKKGTHNTDDLISRADHIFSEKMRDKLPAEAREDLKNAGTCLAFDLHSAAGFHFLRATESVLREYCRSFTEKMPRSGNWGAWIGILERHNADASIITTLHHIRTTYRNRLIHPDIVLDADDAIVIHGITHAAILMMMRDIDKRSPKKLSQPKLRNLARNLNEQ